MAKAEINSAGARPVGATTNAAEDPIIARARAFALDAHGGQRYGEQPYVVHLDAVAAVAREHGMPPHVVAAAYLHDVLEDVRRLAKADIGRAFGPKVAGIVEALTKAPDPLYEVRKYFIGIRDAGVDAVFVKLADRLCNVRESVGTSNIRHLGRYRGEHAMFKDTLRRPGEHAELWAEMDRLLGP